MNTGMLRVLIDGAYDRAFSRVFLDEFSDFGYAGPETVCLPQDTPHVFLVDTLNSKEPFALILLKKGCRGRTFRRDAVDLSPCLRLVNPTVGGTWITAFPATLPVMFPACFSDNGEAASRPAGVGFCGN